MSAKKSGRITQRLQEGESYPFRIVNVMTMPETNDEYYIMEEFSGKRLLMAAHHYKNYDLSAGQEIICRVDRINCNGKIFLEPRHPYYHEGEIYDFDLIRYDRITDPLGEEQDVVVVKDIYYNEVNCLSRDRSFNTGGSGKVRCRVDQIKKGRLLLVHPDINKENELLNEGDTYRFKIIDTDKIINDEAYYVLVGPFNEKHLIRKENYEEYGLEKGRYINCIVDKINSQGKYSLEPEHPYYIIGNTYDFVFVRKDLLDTSYGKREPVLIVKDIFGKENYVFFHDENITDISGSLVLRCRVDKFRRGKLHLSVIEK